MLQALWTGGRAQPLLDWGLDVGARALAEHEPLVRAQVKGRTPRWMPKWVNKRISNKVVAALIDLAAEMRAPDHPWRIELKRAVEEFIVRLDTDPALAARVDELKLALISDPLVLGHLDRLRQDLEASLGSLDGRRAKAFSASMARAFVAFGEWLDTDKEAGAIINSWARAAATQVVAPQRKQIGVFIAQVVAGWDTRSVVDKLELQVGKDLQYIRVNGTLVGGLVGLVIFTVARLIGLE